MNPSRTLAFFRSLRLCRDAIPRRLFALVASLVPLLAVPAPAAEPDSPVGVWRSLDASTGEARALIRIDEHDGHYFGRIEWSADPEDRTNTCTHCRDERKDAPIIGLVLIRNLERVGTAYRNGDILDPRSGKVYRCEVRLEQGGTVLVVHGYLGVSLIGGSQRWYRVS